MGLHRQQKNRGAECKLGLVVFGIVIYVCVNLYLAPKALVIPQVDDLPSRPESGEKEPPVMKSHSVEQVVTNDDARTNVKNRPWMQSAANAYMTRVLDIERAHGKIDAQCTKWGGSQYLQGISSSSHDIITSDSSSIKRLSGVGDDSADSFFIAQNVSISIHMNGEFQTKKDKLPQITMHYRGSDVNSYPSKKGSVLDQIKFDPSGVGACDHYLQYPVMLVDSNIDSWNW